MANVHDKSVLNAILNPLVPLNDDDDEHDDEPAIPLTTAERDAKALEERGVQLAEQSRLAEALGALTAAIAACTTRVSCYNNRAQVYRLMHRNDEARVDLNTAIALAEQQHMDATKPNRSIAHAFTQRAMLCRLEKNDEQARADFEHAAAHGCTFAKGQLVAMNPYAAMCNKMLADVMGKLQRGEPTDDTDVGA